MRIGSHLLEGRRRTVVVWILALGFACSAVLYLTAAPPVDDPLGYRPEDTKRYLREMEVYGGKANVMASELRQAFEGLWHGRNLAFTVAFLTVLAAALYVIGSTPLPAPDDDGFRPRQK